MTMLPTLPGSRMSDNPWWGCVLEENRDEDGGYKSPHQDLWGQWSDIKMKQQTLHNNTRRLIAIFQWGAKATEHWEDSTAPLNESSNYYNAAQNFVETVHSKVCKTQIRPMPSTQGSGYLARRRARDLGKAIEGVFDDNGIEQIKEDVVLDALVTDHGGGAAMVFSENKKLRIEHTPIEDYYIDDSEARYRKPRCLYRRVFMDRYVALARWANPNDEDDCLFGSLEDRERAIRNAPQADARDLKWSDRDMIEVLMAWHLPSRAPSGDDDGSGDGCFAIITKEGSLVVDEFDREHFPVAFYIPRPRRRHFWGLSLMRNFVAPQTEYERNTEKMQIGFARSGGAQFAIPKGSNVESRDISNGLGVGFEYEGQTPPTPFNFSPFPAEFFQYYQLGPQLMAQHTGVSQFSASSQIPTGLEKASGKALQLVDDIESDRLMPYHKPLERWIINLMWLIIDEVEDIVQDEEDLEVRYRSKSGIETFRWKDLLGKPTTNDNGVRYARDYDFEVFPVSNLARTPAAKFDQLQQMLNAGAITVPQFKRLFEIPDLESELGLDNADTDVIDMALDKMVCKGIYTNVEPFDDFDLIIKRAGKAVNLFRQQEVPEEKLAFVHQYIADAKAQKKKAMAAAAAQGGPPGGGPGLPPGGPAPPPMVPPGGPLPGGPGPVAPPPMVPPGGAPPVPMAA